MTPIEPVIVPGLATIEPQALANRDPGGDAGPVAAHVDPVPVPDPELVRVIRRELERLPGGEVAKRRVLLGDLRGPQGAS